MRIGGADPGKKGVVVVVGCGVDDGIYYRLQYDKAGHLDDAALLAFLVMAQPQVMVIEKVQGRGGSGATQTFNFGFAAGELNALMHVWSRLHGMALFYASPQAWQKDFHAGMAETLSAKERSLLAYGRLFPHRPGRLPHAKATDDNLVDALLMATFGVLRFGHGGLRPWTLLQHVEVPVATGTAGSVLLPNFRRSKP